MSEHSEAAVGPLVERLKDESARVRREAAKALGDLADPAAAPALVELLEDEESGVRWVAAEALIALERGGLPALLAGLEHRADSPRLREGAGRVLRGLPIWRLVELLAPVVEALERTAAESTVPVAAGAALHALRRDLPPRSFPG